MQTEQQSEPKRVTRVTARRVKPLFLRLFRHASVSSLLELRSAITDGRSFDGKRNDTCIYGNLGKGAGHSYVGDTPEQLQAKLRTYGHSIGLEIKVDGHLDPIEQFCAQAGRGDSILTNSALNHVHDWLLCTLHEKGVYEFVEHGLDDVIGLAGEGVAII